MSLGLLPSSTTDYAKQESVIHQLWQNPSSRTVKYGSEQEFALYIRDPMILNVRGHDWDVRPRIKQEEVEQYRKADYLDPRYQQAEDIESFLNAEGIKPERHFEAQLKSYSDAALVNTGSKQETIHSSENTHTTKANTLTSFDSQQESEIDEPRMLEITELSPSEVWGSSNLATFILKDANGKKAQELALYMYEELPTAHESIEFNPKLFKGLGETRVAAVIPNSLLETTTSYNCPVTGKELTRENTVQLRLFKMVMNKGTPEEKEYLWVNMSRTGVRQYLMSKPGAYIGLPKCAKAPSQIEKADMRAMGSNALEDGYFAEHSFNDPIVAVVQFFDRLVNPKTT